MEGGRQTAVFGEGAAVETTCSLMGCTKYLSFPDDHCFLGRSGLVM